MLHLGFPWCPTSDRLQDPSIVVPIDPVERNNLDGKENVVLLGPPGVGKNHLEIGLAIAAAKFGRRVYYSTLADLVTNLEEAQAAGDLSPRNWTRVLSQ